MAQTRRTPSDEGYDAFVKLYRDNSDVKAQYDICLPNGSLK
jgi:hypothetical protein